MGVLLTPIIIKDPIALDALRGRTLAVDANCELAKGLVDLAILVGTDFNQGIKGIGPKKALKLVQQYGHIEHMPETIRQALESPDSLDQVRHIFLVPEVTDSFTVEPMEPDIDGIVRFLCEEREFSRERVSSALERTFRERSLW